MHTMRWSETLQAWEVGYWTSGTEVMENKWHPLFREEVAPVAAAIANYMNGGEGKPCAFTLAPVRK